MERKKIASLQNDEFYKFLLRSGINLEFYDIVMWLDEYLKKFIETKSLDFEFWISGTSIAYSGVKTIVLFLWVKNYDLETAEIKMLEILNNLNEDDLEDMSKHSLKQTLIRIRNTDINLN